VTSPRGRGCAAAAAAEWGWLSCETAARGVQKALLDFTVQKISCRDLRPTRALGDSCWFYGSWMFLSCFILSSKS